MSVVVAGGAGFIGSHLVDALLARGDMVHVLDDYSTGDAANLADARLTGRLVEHRIDVAKGVPALSGVREIYHLASPASPPAYLAHPLETLAVGSEGTRHLLELAQANGARFLLASTSEVYGEPLEHPQRESYFGNVNPVGPRSVYDEAKRFAEALTTAFHQVHGTPVSIVRIFNTYGPRLAPGDGRVVSNFITQSLDERPITVFGTGTQTRSLCYVSDLVRGLLAACGASIPRPINLGNPHELTVLEIAERVQRFVGGHQELRFEPLPEGDPSRRRPDVTLAETLLGWSPTISVDDGLAATVAYFRELPRG